MLYINRDWPVANGGYILQVQKETIRNNIIEVALDEFFQNGYEKTSMNTIATRCNISKSNMYRYFTSKEEIYEILIEPTRKLLLLVTKHLTSKELLDYPREVMVEMMVSELSKAIIGNRKQILIILHSDQSTSDKLIKQQILEEMIGCFLDFDLEKMPKAFSNVLANMIMSGLTSIIEHNEDIKEIHDQLKSLFSYHSNGCLALTSRCIEE